ncbi:MAG: GGDEF domain-containing protein [Thermoanaerobaculales bacterium]|nr:GGDEF domain-containing protein [Thermoanaerobaculales bacterium]
MCSSAQTRPRNSAILKQGLEVRLKNLPGRITIATAVSLPAAGWITGLTELPSAYLPFAERATEFLAIFSIILAWRFRRSRIFLAAMTLALANQLIRGPLTVEISTGFGPGLAALAILLPLNLGLIGLFRDRSVVKVSTLICLAAIFIQPALVSWVLSLGLSENRFGRWFDLAQTPQASLLAFLIATVFTLVALTLRRGVFEIGMLGVLTCCALAMHGDRGLLSATLLLAAAQLVLLLGLVEDSHKLAFLDELTELPARRAFNEALRSLTGTYAIAMVDIDHFKRFNDRYGHQAGDQALRMVADSLRATGGRTKAYRYGGEEFALIFSGQSVASARPHLEDLRRAIADRKFSIRSPERPQKKPDRPKKSKKTPPQAKLTVSIGVAGPTADRSESGEVLRAADRSLYRAKRSGRNRLVGS